MKAVFHMSNTNGQPVPAEAFGLRASARGNGPDGGPGGRPRGSSYGSAYGPPYAAGPIGYHPAPTYTHDPYFRDYYYHPPPAPQGYPPRTGAYGGTGNRSPRGGRLSERLGGFASYDGFHRACIDARTLVRQRVGLIKEGPKTRAHSRMKWANVS